MSFVSVDSRISEPRFRRAWRDDNGYLHAIVQIGETALYLDSAADARAIAAACTEAEEALDTLESGSDDKGASL